MNFEEIYNMRSAPPQWLWRHSFIIWKQWWKDTQSKVWSSSLQTCNAIVALDLLTAPRAFPRCVSLHPVVNHPLGRAGGFDVSGNARGWSSLHASLVHRVFAHYMGKRLVTGITVVVRWMYLTCATEAFTAHACKNIKAKVAICRLVKVFQPP